jgi:thymidylate synthase
MGIMGGFSRNDNVFNVIKLYTMNQLDVTYQQLLQDILENGVEKSDRTGTGTISVFGRQIRHKMSEGFPLLTTKKMYFKGIVTELLWFLKGDTNIKYLVDNNCHIWDGDAYNAYQRGFKEKHYLKPTSTKEEFIERIKTDDEFAKVWGELGPIYGRQWRNWDVYDQYRMKAADGTRFYGKIKPIDQIANLINDLKTNPDSRRLMVNAWNVGELDQMVLPPCHYGFQVYTRELSLEERMTIWNERIKGLHFVLTWGNGKTQVDALDEQNIPKRAISLMWNQRSVDTPLGLPFNIASYALLLAIIGKMVNMVPDELIGNLGDTHIYKNQIDGIKEQLTREPYQLPKLIMSNNVNFNDTIDEFLNSCLISDFQIENYQSHPSIKMPLSN